MKNDMKRLCTATYRVMEQHRSAEERGDLYETLVRAVLTELREPSEAMLTEGLHERNVSGIGPRGLPLCFKRMIDAVLA